MPFRRVPFELPLSCSAQYLPSQNSSACFSDTALSFIQTLLALVLPTVSFSTPGLQNSVPWLGPAVTLSLSSSGSVSSSSAWHVPCCFLVWKQQTDHSPPTWLPPEASFSLSIKRQLARKFHQGFDRKALIICVAQASFDGGVSGFCSKWSQLCIDP